MQLHRKTQFQVSKSCAALKKLTTLHEEGEGVVLPATPASPALLLAISIMAWQMCLSSESCGLCGTANSLEFKAEEATPTIAYIIYVDRCMIYCISPSRCVTNLPDWLSPVLARFNPRLRLLLLLLLSLVSPAPFAF